MNRLKRHIKYYRLLAKDKRVPAASRWLLVAAIGYAVSPLDLIPDWIPVIGWLDELIVLPALVVPALLLIPRELKADCWEKAAIGRNATGLNPRHELQCAGCSTSAR